MALPNKILVATDFTETSARALDYAVELAKVFGASVTLLHAYEPILFDKLDGALAASGNAQTHALHTAELSLDAAVAKYPGFAITTRLEKDAPWEAVNATAEDIAADLIVIGTHSRHGLSRVLHQSAAENIIRHATRPVLTIH